MSKEDPAEVEGTRVQVDIGHGVTDGDTSVSPSMNIFLLVVLRKKSGTI